MASTTTSIDYSRVFHTTVGTSEITVQIWSEGPAGFDEPVDDYDIHHAMQHILAGRARENRDHHGRNTPPKADTKHLTTP